MQDIQNTGCLGITWFSFDWECLEWIKEMQLSPDFDSAVQSYQLTFYFVYIGVDIQPLLNSCPSFSCKYLNLNNLNGN